MITRAPRKVKPGDPIQAKDWNYLIDLITRNAINPSTCPGLGISQGWAGTNLVLTDPTPPGSLGVTTTTITARVTTTPGTGSVELYQLNASGVITDANVSITVYNLSSTTGGIASGSYVFVQQDATGTWWIVSVDCAN